MQLLSEFILVAVASAIVIYEYNRSVQKDEEKQFQIEQEKKEIRERIQDLEFTVEKQSAQLKELTRLAIAIRDDLQKSLLPKPNKGFFGKKDDSEVPSVPPLSPELMDVFENNSKRNNDKNSAINNNVNNIADKLKDVSFINADCYNHSNPVNTNRLFSQSICDEDLDLDKLAPRTITKIVEKYLGNNDYELVDM